MPKLFSAAVLSAALSILAAGCSDDQAHLKELARYTPENLSQEVLSRYKTSLKRPPASAEAKAAAKSGRSTADDDKERAAVAKYGAEAGSHDTASDGKGMTLDALAANVAKKVKLVEGMTPAQVLAKLDAAVDADAELPDAEKDKLKAALKAAVSVSP